VIVELAERFASVRLRSPLARAVVPVVAGAVVIALILLATWGVAAVVRHNPSEQLAPSTFRVGNVERLADEIAENGPLLFPGLDTTTGERTLVIDHEGEDPARGWRTYWAYPADRNPSCAVTQEERTRRFTDCDGRPLDVEELARPETVRPIVENQRTLFIDLQYDDAPTTT
jgi:transglutaminase-like putative cysteine protease